MSYECTWLVVSCEELHLVAGLILMVVHVVSHLFFSMMLHYCLLSFFFFFFSSRRRHTRSDRDWSSDVCSSDLDARALEIDEDRDGGVRGLGGPSCRRDPPRPHLRSAVGGVHPDHVGARVDQARDALGRRRRGPERDDDLGAADHCVAPCVSAATSAGSTAPARPRQTMCAASDSSVGSGLTSMTVAPASRAIRGS